MLLRRPLKLDYNTHFVRKVFVVSEADKSGKGTSNCDNEPSANASGFLIRKIARSLRYWVIESSNEARDNRYGKLISFSHFMFDSRHFV